MSSWSLLSAGESVSCPMSRGSQFVVGGSGGCDRLSAVCEGILLSSEWNNSGNEIVFGWILLSFGYGQSFLQSESVVSDGIDVSSGKCNSNSMSSRDLSGPARKCNMQVLSRRQCLSEEFDSSGAVSSGIVLSSWNEVWDSVLVSEWHVWRFR